MEEMIAAILDDDTSAAKRLLRADAGLATRLIRNPKLYDSGKVCHGKNRAACSRSAWIRQLLLGTTAVPGASGTAGTGGDG